MSQMHSYRQLISKLPELSLTFFKPRSLNILLSVVLFTTCVIRISRFKEFDSQTKYTTHIIVHKENQQVTCSRTPTTVNLWTLFRLSFFIWLNLDNWPLLQSGISWVHDDVIKWKHFPRYWPFVRGIHRSPVTSPHKGQWRGGLMFSLICISINGWVNSGGTGD